ncbi:MAG TPA: isoaspartyl peptidase/L-asparaginase [Flavitalea sp.]|nr:isoaspartyl peptidase/L-asparaginase [Flavitalea sp.]
MKNLLFIVLISLFNTALAQTIHNPVLVIHGGAGTILKKNMSPEKEKAYTTSLEEALRKGYAILQNGGSSLDAVEAVVRTLEDNPLFNAGKGAVFTNEGKIELDAAIMNGKTLAAGSVAGVTTIKNPIAAARAVMEKSEHVMMIGRGAEQFAKQQGITIVDPSYFYTEERWKSLERIRKADSLKATSMRSDDITPTETRDSKFGTVGAVALDKQGNLAAATSTGGMTNKKFGRVGDVPIIGAGTYANNTTCAISCTGWGEFFIRLVMAKTVSDMMEYGKMSLNEAASEMIMKKLPSMKGDGGLIGVDKSGNITMPFCSEGMYRGFIDRSGKMEIRIYKD